MSKGTRDRSARDRLADERRLQEKRDRQKKALCVIGGAVTLIVVAVALAVLVNSGRGKSEAEYTGAVVPATRQADGSIVMAKPGVTTPVMEIYEDFQCPACQNLEKVSGNTIKRLAAEGRVKVIYRPFRLFDQEPTRGNSQRAANAALCAPADRWVHYHDVIYQNQPEETRRGFAAGDLISWAAETGITGSAFENCVNNGAKNTQVQQMTDYAMKVGKVTQSPTVKLNGKDVTRQAFVPADLDKAISSAR